MAGDDVVLLLLATAGGEEADVVGGVRDDAAVFEGELRVDVDYGTSVEADAVADPARLYVAPFKSRLLRISKEPLLKKGAPTLRVGPCWRTKLESLKELSKSRGTSADEAVG